MGMTMAEKIFADHSDKEEVKPGEYIFANLDLVMGHDVSAPRAIRIFRKMGAKKVFNKDKVVLLEDHFVPNKDVNSAENCKLMKEFALEQELTHYYPVGRAGICHAFLPESGMVLPGQLIVGGDSHTCTYGALAALGTGVGATDLAVAMALGKLWFKVPETIKITFKGKPSKWITGKDLILFIIGQIGVEGAKYKSLEFDREALTYLSVSDRLTIANMAVEAGAKCCLMPPDAKIIQYCKERARDEINISFLESDVGVNYEKVLEFDITKMEPQVAFPYLPSNVKPISKIGKIKIDQVVIGSCTNGRLEDLRLAAEILKGKKVSNYLRLIIIPATQKIYLNALAEGLLKIFVEAGGVINPPSCGPCLGAQMGVLAAGEKAVSTTNRNFVGRMGHKESEIYLASPLVAAASAVKGYIADPRELLM